MKIKKKQKEIRSKLEDGKKYSLDDALKYVKEGATTKYDETVDVAIRLGTDPKQSDQQVRGAVVLPHGMGKGVRVLAFVKGEKEKEAKEAGADYISDDDIVEKIKGGWLEFDAVVATPDMMAAVSKVGKILGPRGLMPNPKLGTVSFDVKKAVSDCKAGKVEFRNEKAAIIHAAFGKVSFSDDQLKENLKSVLETVQKLKPQTSKGIYLKSLAIASTMGPGLRVDMSDVAKLVA
jgi:large subunit ribosomal protein L1